jgi:hypothetical protein
MPRPIASSRSADDGRLTVPDLAVWHERLGRSADAIATAYVLSLAAMDAALADDDQREAMDQAMRADDDVRAALRQRRPATLRARRGRC